MRYKYDKPLQGKIGKEKYKCTIEWRNGKIVADEPESPGGTDSGPDPHSLLLSSLAACTLITLRMYIDRKQWDIPEITVKTNLYYETKEGVNQATIDQEIIFAGNVDEKKKLRLKDIASRCPISKIIENETMIRTFSGE